MVHGMEIQVNACLFIITKGLPNYNSITSYAFVLLRSAFTCALSVEYFLLIYVEFPLKAHIPWRDYSGFMSMIFAN